MVRHSFLQIQKITNVKERIDYISSHERQENLYATFQTSHLIFWKNLSEENQQEFFKSGTAGTCIEARELIIALPEICTQYEPQQILETFTMAFKERYQVECVSALHHNKRKTNYHIHLIFSERQLLSEIETRIASRNMFYNEQGKHVRTKKEILDENGMIRKGCNIVLKGEVYDRRMFTNKNPYFKTEEFLMEEKRFYTERMNQYIENPVDQLQVFNQSAVYLPTKKIGKNNPKEVEILADNKIRKEWNYFVEEALIVGVEEIEIHKIKKEKITLQIPKLREEQNTIKGIFRGKERKAIDEEITTMENQLVALKSSLNRIVRNGGYETVRSFIQVYQNAEIQVLEYQKAMKQYQAYGGEKPLEIESVKEKLLRLTKEIEQKESNKNDRIKLSKNAR